MSENVTIKINEYDKTSPAGSGVDSTDIAFIPGFSVLATAPQNKPTLVTSTREFEKLFGSKPRVLTSRDVAAYADYGFKAGDFDRSYVYAKELLFQGMPVIYSNLVMPDAYEEVELVEASVNTKGIDGLTVTSDASAITITADKEVEGSFDLTVKTSVEVALAETNIPVITTCEFAPFAEGCSVTSFAIDEDNIKPMQAKVVIRSAQQVEFINKTDVAEDVTLTFKMTIKVAMQKDDEATIKVADLVSSVLDAFYKSYKYDGENDGYFVNKQWEVDGDDTIADKSIYSVKYITSGGYPSVVSASDAEAKQVFSANMLAAAAHRGDAVALIDYQLKETERVFAVEPESKTFYAKMHAQFNDAKNAEYGAMMAPWSLYNCGSTLSFADSTAIEMPASFGYLMCVAKAIKSSPNWLAMAGVTRGLVPSISKLLVPGNVISNSIAEEMQPKFGVENHRISINTITNIRPYGLTLWGNRTLKPVSKDGTVALNFLNTRNMLSDIKKLLYTTAKACMFEQNSTDLWIKFKGGIEPLLRRQKAGNGISDYQIVRGTTKYNGDPLTKGEIAAVIKIYPMHAVEYFELAVEINDEEVTVS